MLRLSSTKILAVFLLSVLVFIATLCTASTVHAASGSLTSPLEPGSVWYICQGYNSPRTHTGGDALSLDFTRQLCDGSSQSNTSSAGSTVRAPMSGSIYWYSSTYGALCVNTFDNRSILLVHIDSSLGSGAVVSSGQTVGSIASAGARGNAGIAHLHLQMWDKPNCYNGNAIPFDSSHNSQVCGAPDLATSGPNYYRNGTWSGVSFLPADCSGRSPVYRFFSPVVTRHLYTASQAEANDVSMSMRGVWNFEKIAFYVDSVSNCAPGRNVYRFYSTILTTHLYTMNEAEKDWILSTFATPQWRYEGVAYCADQAQTSPDEKPVYRFYSSTLGTHLYTNDESEKNWIQATFSKDVWNYEGIAYWAYPQQ